MCRKKFLLGIASQKRVEGLRALGDGHGSSEDLLCVERVRLRRSK